MGAAPPIAPRSLKSNLQSDQSLSFASCTVSCGAFVALLLQRLCEIIYAEVGTTIAQHMEGSHDKLFATQEVEL